MRLYLDYETWSRVAIRRGTDVYMDGAKPLLATWAVDEGPVHFHDFTADPNVPVTLRTLLDIADEIIAHNAFFDRMVTRKLCRVETSIFRWRCTMAQALSHGLPGGLGNLCTVLDVPVEDAKIADGKRLIKKFCCGPEILKNDPEWQLFIDYAINDITAMRECHKRMPNWNLIGEELRLWHIDQLINERGFAVDVQLAEKAIESLKKEKDRLDDEVWIRTCGSVSAATQRDKLLLFLCEQQGCVLSDLRAPTINEALEDESLDESTKELLRIRLAAAKTSTSKFKRMLDSVGLGNRLRGTLQFAGAARTARWAGRIFQPQNLPRPNMKLEDIRNVIELIRNGVPDLVALFAPIGQACMNVLRGLIIAAAGNTLMISDYSAIEGRANAWLAGEDWKVKAFRNKEDMYCRIYEQAFGLPAGSVGKKDPRRQMGKVMELALGYQGGVGAFINMAAVYHLDLEELGRMVEPEEKSLQAWEDALVSGETYGLSKAAYCACDTLKIRYRRANPAIQGFWYQLQEAATRVIEAKDPTLKVHVGMLTFDCNKSWMRIRLPSGRYLCYAMPKLSPSGEITYMSWRNKQWVRTKTYGGKLCENIVQAVSRDLLGFALLGMHDNDFWVVLHVHDEIVAEVSKARAILDLTFEHFNRIMQTRPKWAAGFPLEAEGYENERYEKR
jgi:DNA polymerase